MTTDSKRDVVIAVATYRRPDLLSELLRSLEHVATGRFRVIVIDNDAEGSGRKAAESSELALDYSVEAHPGIAAARNAALDRLLPSDNFLVFVDDDERVTSDWLEKLLTTQQTEKADVVAGPVISVFPPETPKWVTQGKFIQRARFATGSIALSPATNNTLVRIAFLRDVGFPRFDESFSMTGGSDTEFFRRLRNSGARMVWCNEAIVYEDVPLARTTFAWIFRRGVREGNVSGRLRLASVGRSRLFLEGVSRILLGTIRQCASFITLRGLRARDIAYITRGLGWIGASRDRLVVEYARPTAKKSS